MKHSISTVEELQFFIYSPNFYADTADLNFPFFDDKTNLENSEKINKYRNACGCDTGGYLLILSGLLFVVFPMSGIPIFGGTVFRQIGFSVLAVFGSAVLGKITGIVYANLRLKFIIRSIENTAQQWVRAKPLNINT